MPQGGTVQELGWEAWLSVRMHFLQILSWSGPWLSSLQSLHVLHQCSE